MQFRQTSTKQILINLSIAALIPLIHYIYGDNWNSEEPILSDLWKGIVILMILGLGMVGAVRELLDLRHVIKGELGWFFLTFLAAAGHIVLFMAAMQYFGYDFEGDTSGTENNLIVFGALVFTVFFLFELLFILANETRKDQYKGRRYGWSDALLSIYAAFGSIYIWDILLGHLEFEYQNIGYFLLAELFPAVLLFLMLILPFKRYDLLEGHGISKTSKEKIYLVLSYLLMIVLAMAPKF